MSVVDLSTRTDTDVLAVLDFTPTLPCEHSQHATRHADEPATWVAHFACSACDRRAIYPICASGRLRLIKQGARCAVCHVASPASDVMLFTPIGAAS